MAASSADVRVAVARDVCEASVAHHPQRVHLRNRCHEEATYHPESLPGGGDFFAVGVHGDPKDTGAEAGARAEAGTRNRAP